MRNLLNINISYGSDVPVPMTLLLHPYYCQLPEYMHFEGVSAGNGIDYSEINKYRIKLLDFLCKNNLYNSHFKIVSILNRIYNKFQRIIFGRDNF